MQEVDKNAREIRHCAECTPGKAFTYPQAAVFPGCERGEVFWRLLNPSVSLGFSATPVVLYLGFSRKTSFGARYRVGREGEPRPRRPRPTAQEENPMSWYHRTSLTSAYSILSGGF